MPMDDEDLFDQSDDQESSSPNERPSLLAADSEEAMDVDLNGEIEVPVEEAEPQEEQWTTDRDLEDLKAKYWGGTQENWPMVLARLSRFDQVTPKSFEEQDEIWDRLDAVGIHMCSILNNLGLAVPMVLNKLFVRVQGHPFPKDFTHIFRSVSSDDISSLYFLTCRGDWRNLAIRFLKESDGVDQLLSELSRTDLPPDVNKQEYWQNRLFKLREMGLRIGSSRTLEFPEARATLTSLLEEYRTLSWQMAQNFMKLAIRESIKFSPRAPHFALENFQNVVEAIFFCIGKYKKGGNFVFYSSRWMKDFLANFVSGLGQDPDKDWMNDIAMLPDGWTEFIPVPGETTEAENQEETLIVLENNLDIFDEPLRTIIIIKNRLLDYWDWSHKSDLTPGQVWDQTLRHLSS